ncbi:MULTISPECIES: ABC transporter permease [unclassified Anaeromyxobacter]|uniref:ABC transporter permease n=1 Tax=unclassified Anaeromyxobacter TaxID=2620896 RepID=UPI001F5635FA|nr:MULTISPECIES: FtsX-like permease family protein [unclassified Anaeromyxobacter]
MTGGWKLALRNLSRNRRRNLVTGAAIALGYAGLVLLGGYANGNEGLIRLSSVYLQHSGHLAVYARGGLGKAQTKPAAYTLDAAAQEEILAALRADPRVEFCGRYLLGTGIAGNGCKTFPFRGLGIELDVERRILSHPQLEPLRDVARPRAGRPLPDAAGEESPVALSVGLGGARLGKAAVTGREAAVAPGALECEAPDVKARIAADPWVQLAVQTHEGSFGAMDARLVSLFQAGTVDGDQAGLVAGLDLFQRLYDTDRVTYVAAYLHDHRDTAAVARDLSQKLAAAGLEVSIYPYDDPKANPYYVGTMETIGAVVTFIGLLLANVVALSVLNAMTLAVLERTREIGTLRSLGFTRRQLLGVFLREAATLAGLSIAAGLLLALAVSAGVRAAKVRFQPPGVGGTIPLVIAPSAGMWVGAAALLLVLALGATWVAVRRRVRERVAKLIVEVAA